MNTEPIRVLHVIGGLNRGGAETMIMNLYRAIDKSQIQFDFIVHSSTENAYFQEVNNWGGKIYVFPKFDGKNILAYRRQWTSFLKSHKEYKILHSHVRSYALVFLGIAKKYGLKTIVHSHSTSNGKSYKSIIKRIFQYPIRKKSDYLFACSAISGKWLFGEKALGQTNYKMIKNAIDTELYKLDYDIRKRYREDLGIEGKDVFGHVGRLSEPKNHVFLLKIFAKIHEKNKNAVLLIVGSGILKDSIQRQIQELGLSENVIMLGTRDDVPRILMALDVFLFPSLWEGLPVTVIEAQAAGLPCLVSNKVTHEVAVSDAVKYLPIDQGTECWVEEAMNALGKRYETIEEIKKAGFDVSTSAEELMHFYKGIVDND